MTAVDTGVIYTIGTRMAVDGGIEAGLSGDAPAFAAFGGFSVALGHARAGGSGRTHAHRPPQSYISFSGPRSRFRSSAVRPNFLPISLDGLFELHQRHTDGFDLLARQRLLLHPPDRLTFHQLAQKLDDRQHQLRDRSLHVVGLRVPTQAGALLGAFDPALCAERLVRRRVPARARGGMRRSISRRSARSSAAVTGRGASDAAVFDRPFSSACSGAGSPPAPARRSAAPVRPPLRAALGRHDRDRRRRRSTTAADR